MRDPEESGPETRDPEPPRRHRHWGWIAFVAVVVLVVVAGAAGVAFAGSRRGQRLVLREVLDRARGMLAGSLTVQAIRSPTLLDGATLVGLRLDAAGGRPFLSVDSLRVHYSLLSLLTGRPRLTSVVLWNPRVEITRYPGERDANVSGLLREKAPAAHPGADPRIVVNRISVRGGSLEVLTPLAADASPRTLRVPSPQGRGELRRIALDSLDADFSDVILRPGGTEPFVGTVTAIAMQVHLLDRPLRILDGQGSLSYGPQGLALRSATVRLPGSLLAGDVRLGPLLGPGSDWTFAADLRTRGPASLADLQWIDPRIPDGAFEGGVTVTAGQSLEADFDDLRMELEASRLRLDGGVAVGPRVEFRNLSVEVSPLSVSALEPWLGRKLPLAGWLQGSVTLTGTPAALSTKGTITIVPTDFGGLPTTVAVKGVLHGGSNPGFSDFEARLDPLNFPVLGAVVHSLDIPGTGSAVVDLTGRVDQGVHVAVDVAGAGDSATASHLRVRGSVQRSAHGRWSANVQADLAPLALSMLSRMRPDLGLGGSVEGSLRAVGPLDSLRVSGDLTGAGGRLALDGTVNARAPRSSYDLRARLADLHLSRLVARLPRPTDWSGTIHLTGRGFAPGSMAAVATVAMGGSRIGGLRIDTVSARLRAADGVLGIDTLDADLGGMHVSGSGRLGMIGSAAGAARLRFASDSLIGLRPLLMGDTVIARDTLTVLEKELLRFQGVNPDTLPDTAQVAMSGSLRGEAHVSGRLDSLDVDATARLDSAVYGLNRVGSASVRVQAFGLASPRTRLSVALDAAGVRALDRSFQAVQVDAETAGGRGRATVRVRRRPGETYALAGSFALDSAGGSVDLEQASATFDSLVWRTVRPTRIAWDSSSIRVDSLRIVRAGPDPMSVLATGTLSRAGDSDFRLDASGVSLDRASRLVQLDSLGLGGRLDLGLRVTGPAAAPVIDGSFDVTDPRLHDLQLTRVTGTLGYRSRSARIALGAWNGSTRVLTVGGTVPVDLALTPGRRPEPDVPMDVEVRADSLAASLALSPMSVLRNVKGTVSGEFRVGGTLKKPEPSGVLQLQDASWGVEALGVRHTRVDGSLTLHRDRTVDVHLVAHAAGTAEVTGKIALDSLSDPGLDLAIHLARFEAVSRSDVAARVSGDLSLKGSYDLPKVGGKLTVDQATLYLEEFARSADVVDLSDPDVFDIVDTTLVSSRPILAEVRNPFLQNLLVSVDLSVASDTWLRSQDMSAEIGGELIVTYDRQKRELVLVGHLDTQRGSYTFLGRRFEVQSGGTVGFIGTPGIDPTLDIQAVARIRRVGSEPLAVTATVSGSLDAPRVSLSTGEQGLSQSDLVSYLVFGRPASQLSSGQSSLVQGAAGAGLTWATGQLANQLGAAVAQQIGVSYLSISQAADYQAGNVGILSSTLANTQVEIGQYVSQNVYVVLVLRKPTAGGGSATGWLGRTEVDWALSDNYNAQGFVEDRYLQSQAPGLADLAQNSQILGVFIYRDWGY